MYRVDWPLREIENIGPAPASLPPPPLVQNSLLPAPFNPSSFRTAPCTCDQGSQTCPELDVRSIGVQTVEQFQDHEPKGELTSTIEKLSKVSQRVGLVRDFSVREFISCSRIAYNCIGRPLKIHNSACSWSMHFSVYMFLFNGNLWTDFDSLSSTLGLPSCSHTHWRRCVKKLESHVTELAERSCGQVRDAVQKRGDKEKWVASYDGFYLTRGHYSNNSSSTLHDYSSGKVAWFTHRTKRGDGHSWEGTSGGAEGDMLDEILGKVKAAGFTISEIVTDKDSSMNAIYCRHFPEGTITYCSNHCSKTLHKDLLKIKQAKCGVSNSGFYSVTGKSTHSQGDFIPMGRSTLL